MNAEKKDYEIVTSEEETQIINDLKRALRDVVTENGHYSGIEKPSCFAVYALLELAAEVSVKGAADCGSLFIEAAHEVNDVFSRDPGRLLNY